MADFQFQLQAAGFWRQARRAGLAVRLPAALLFIVLAGAFSGKAAAESAQTAAAEPQACATVRLAETGWTDNAAATAVTAQILQGLGYQTETRLLSVPVLFSAMGDGDIDVFLGYWQPSMTADIKPYLERGAVQIIRYNLQGARYGLAVPRYAYDAGLRSLADIARFAAPLGGKIYGVEPGNDANRIVLAMIDADTDKLGAFQLVESSEQAMLAEVEAAIADKKPIVFLAWQPHPMNKKFQLAYLSGAEAFFGAGVGGASVGTVARQNYARQCPNVGRFLQNLSFTPAQENAIMDKILTEGQEPEAAARAWLRDNPSVVAGWLAGVRSRSGADGLAAVEKALTKE